MRAWAVVENGQPLKEIELPTPEPTGTEVLLEVTHCGVCHSDLHIWEGYYDVGGGQKMSLVDRGVTLPLAMGHEIVGRVVKLGPDATGVKVGDLRIVFPWLGCGKCEQCLSEERQHVRGRGPQPGRLPERRLRHARRRPAPAAPGRSRHARSRGRRDLRLLRHHRLFRHQEGDAADPDAADRAGRRRRPGPERHRRAEGLEASEHHQRRRQRRKARSRPEGRRAQGGRRQR